MIKGGEKGKFLFNKLSCNIILTQYKKGGVS